MKKILPIDFLKGTLLSCLAFFAVSTASAQNNPVAVNDTATVNYAHQTWINVLENDFDPDGDDLAVFHVNDPVVGDVLQFSDSSILYRNKDDTGKDSLMYKIRKKNFHQFQDSAWLFIDVIPNLPPVVVPDTLPIMVGDTLILNIYDYAYDPEGDDFELHSVRGPYLYGDAGKLSDSTFWVTMIRNYLGVDEFSVTILDIPSNIRIHGKLYLDVEQNPEYPFAINDTLNALPGDTITIHPLENDYDLQGDPLVMIDVDDEFYTTFFEFDDHTITIVPKADTPLGMHEFFTYFASEAQEPLHISNMASGYLNLLENPNLPQAVNDTVTITAGFPVEIHALLNDFDINGDSLRINYVYMPDSYGFVEYTDSMITVSPYCYLTEDIQLQYSIVDKQNPAHYAKAVVYIHIIENTNQPVAVDDTVYLQSYDSVVFHPVQNDNLPYPGQVALKDRFLGYPFQYVFEVNVDPNEPSQAKAHLRVNHSGTISLLYRFYYQENPAMISDYGKIHFMTSPDPDSVLAVDDEITINSFNPNSFNLLANDVNPMNENIFIFKTTGRSEFEVLEHNDSLLFIQPFPLITGDYKLHYLLIKDSHVNPFSSFATVNIHVPDFSMADSLTINNIHAGFTAYGMNFWDNGTEKEIVNFEVPAGSGKQTIFSNTMWIGGIHEDSLYLAAEMFRQKGEDFWAGPVSNAYPEEDLMKYGVRKINRSEIDYHISHYRDPDYEPIEAIATWPGNGNTDLGQADLLAPWFDNDLDGVYNPHAGDTPLIRGDQSLFFIYNDVRNEHTESGGGSLGIEIHGNAYAFDQPDDSALFHTIFVHYDIYNRSGRTHDSTYIGLFTDFALGFLGDDFIGCDVSRGSFYAYNGNAVDGWGSAEHYGANPPVQGVVFLGGATMPHDETDNPSGGCNESINGLNFGDGIVDNERYGMTAFTYLYFASISPHPDITPETAPEYYDFLRSRWIDGSPVMYGGNYNRPEPMAVGPECKFMYPGDSDPLNWGTGCELPNGGYNQNGYYWNEETTGNPPGNRAGLGITGPFTFAPGEVQSLDLAYVYARDNDTTDNISAIDIMNQRIDTLRNRVMRGEIIYLPEYSVGIAENDPVSLEVSVYPNPVRDGQIYVNLTRITNSGNCYYSLKDVSGRTIRSDKLRASQINQLNVSGIKSGFYLLGVESGQKQRFFKILIL